MIIKWQKRKSLKDSFKISTTNRDISVSTDIKYAEIHQKGGSYEPSVYQAWWIWANIFNMKGSPQIKRIRIKKRNFIGFDSKDEKMADNMITRLLKQSESE